LIALGVGGCTQRADKELCEKAADNLVEVSVQAKVAKAGETAVVDVDTVRETALVDAKEARARFMNACTSAPETTVRCIERAKDLGDVQNCQQ